MNERCVRPGFWIISNHVVKRVPTGTGRDDFEWQATDRNGSWVSTRRTLDEIRADLAKVR